MLEKLIIRDATPLDIPEVAKLHIDSWAKTYEHIIEQEYLDNMKNNLNRRIERMTNEFSLRKMIVATVDDEIVGFSEFVFSREFSEDLEIDCELCGLYVKNEYLNLGIGTALFEYVVKLFKDANKKRMGLWCVKENKPAISFYEKKSGQKVKEKEFTLASKSYTEVAYIYNIS